MKASAHCARAGHRRGLNLSDMEVGDKVFGADVLRRVTLTSDRFGFEPEITIRFID